MSVLNRIAYDLRRNKTLLLMMLPGLTLLVVFKYLPMYGLLISFQNYQLFKGFFASPWVGLKNFQKFVNDPFFFRLIRNTFMLGLYNLLWTFPAPILFAILLN